MEVNPKATGSMVLLGTFLEGREVTSAQQPKVGRQPSEVPEAADRLRLLGCESGTRDWPKARPALMWDRAQPRFCGSSHLSAFPQSSKSPSLPM